MDEVPRTASPLTVRPAAPAEAGRLTALARRSKAHWGYSAEFLTACEDELTYTAEQIRAPGWRFGVGEVGGACVGFYALVRRSPEETELEALFVEPVHIGRGHGGRLLEHAKAAAAADGAARLLIQGDPNAAGFYEAAGGVLVGRRESGSVPGRHLPLYALDLSGAGSR